MKKIIKVKLLQVEELYQMNNQLNYYNKKVGLVKNLNWKEFQVIENQINILKKKYLKLIHKQEKLKEN